jgi:hypothetical protein
MNPAAITLVVILIACVVLIAYDVYLEYTGGIRATISYHVYHCSLANPIVPFLAGFIIGILAGHLFWNIE